MSGSELQAEAFGDIEEALVELFDARDILDKIGDRIPAELKAVADKVRKACSLLDRPWP